jgi:putative PIG3 family NAD(P)H quinone oxidoreductase
VHAITIERPGGPEVLRWTEMPEPAPAAGEVLIEVAAAGVNRADVLERQGKYPSPKGVPPYPGMEVSGRIRALGDGVSGWSVGQDVCALIGGGGYAELAVAPAGQVLPVPKTTDVVDAAGLPEVAATVFSNVVELARLQRGETLLVHGGGSGIGTFAVQLGKALGATVVATARAAKRERLLALGADRVIDYQTEDFKTVQADVILDIMGAAYLQRNIDALKTGGRLVVIGLQGGLRAELDLRQLLNKRALVAGTTLRSRPAVEKAAIMRAVHEHVWPLVEQGLIRPVVHARYAMREAAEAHRLLESNEHFGKILLTTGG